MLELEDVEAFYGKSKALHGVSLRVDEGECVAILGRNGAGKSTTLRSIMGQTARRGSIIFLGEDISQRQAHEISRMGIQLVPETRGIFSRLTVRENLLISGADGTQRDRLRRELERYPWMRSRLDSFGDRLSGGEQQMLAFARAMMSDPKLVLIDEPSEGLAPIIVDDLVDSLSEAKASGVSMLLVEQNLEFCLGLADRLYVLDRGEVVFHAPKEEFIRMPDSWEPYLTLG